MTGVSDAVTVNGYRMLTRSKLLFSPLTSPLYHLQQTFYGRHGQKTTKRSEREREERIKYTFQEDEIAWSLAKENT